MPLKLSFSPRRTSNLTMEKRRATGLIRLLTRLIFCWFLKEKGLIPEKLFHPTDLAKLLNGFDPESETSSTYYQAILQNLFFATLNQRMGKDGNGKPYRFFATDEGFLKNRATYDVNNLFRYEKLFAVPQEDALSLFADVPFLNGGLFECLDRTEEGTDKKRLPRWLLPQRQKAPPRPRPPLLRQRRDSRPLHSLWRQEAEKRTSHRPHHHPEPLQVHHR